MNNPRSGVIVLEIALTKPLSRKRGILLHLRWHDMLRLPISNDSISIGDVELHVVQGPVCDEVLLDRPSEAFGPGSTQRWHCRHNAEWTRVEALAARLSKDARYMSAQVLP